MNKKDGLRITGICSICITVYAILFLPQVLIFYKYRKTFREIQHPANTRLVSTQGYLRVLDPIRVIYKDTFEQGCDYLVGEVREYSVTKEGIDTFYAVERPKFVRSDGYRILEFLPMDSRGRVDMLSGDELMLRGLFTVHILNWLRGSQGMGRLNPEGSYYFIGVGGHSQTDLDIRYQ